MPEIESIQKPDSLNYSVSKDWVQIGTLFSAVDKYKRENKFKSEGVMGLPDGEQIRMQPITEDNKILQMTPDLQRLPNFSSLASGFPDTPQSQQTQTLILPPVQTGALSRTMFESLMRTHFGVNRIFNGTITDQQNYLRSASGNPALIFNSPRFREWNPGANSFVYTNIVNGFRLFAYTFGGIPPVNNVGFFGTRFSWNHDTSGIVNETNVPAVYGGGTLLIYSVIMLSSHTIPEGRSNAAPSSVPSPTREEALERIITHELGHGIVEVGLTPPDSTASGTVAPDASLMIDYKSTVGWTSGHNPALYDVGVPEVRAAITAGTIPEARYRIDQTNWNESLWIEQPISAYMTSHPSEDFPEAVMAYINAPNILFVRSPRRFEFIHQRVHQLAPFFRQVSANLFPVGDFPVVNSESVSG